MASEGDAYVVTISVARPGALCPSTASVSEEDGEARVALGRSAMEARLPAVRSRTVPGPAMWDGRRHRPIHAVDSRPYVVLQSSYSRPQSVIGLHPAARRGPSAVAKRTGRTTIANPLRLCGSLLLCGNDWRADACVRSAGMGEPLVSQDRHMEYRDRGFEKDCNGSCKTSIVVSWPSGS